MIFGDFSSKNTEKQCFRLHLKASQHLWGGYLNFVISGHVFLFLVFFHFLDVQKKQVAFNKNIYQWKFGLLHFFNYPPSSGIASCVGTAGTVTWCLHLTPPCCVALGQVLIWVVSPDWFLRSYSDKVFLLLRDQYCISGDLNLGPKAFSLLVFEIGP